MDTKDLVDKVLTSIVSRVVAVLVVVLTPVIGSSLFWLQNAVGIDLQQYKGAAAAFIGTTVLGGLIIGVKWLEGRASFERAAMELKLVHDAGEAAGGVSTPVV